MSNPFFTQEDYLKNGYGYKTGINNRNVSGFSLTYVDNPHMEDKIRNWPTKLLHCALELIESGETLLLGRFGTAEEICPNRFTEEVRREISRRSNAIVEVNRSEPK